MSNIPETSDSLLKIDSLSISYTTQQDPISAVDKVTFEVNHGEAFGLAGESGSGKSTIAQSILKLLPTNAQVLNGKILFENFDILHMSEEKFRTKLRWKRISTVPQAAMNALTPVHKINKQIIEAITTHENISSEEALTRTEKLLETVNIPKERGKDYPHQFSGGMKQRAVMAMALACNPSLLIADEPTTGLDVITQAEVLSLLDSLKSKLGLSLIFITHDLSILSELCDRIAIMYAGRIVELADSRSIFSNPIHPYTKALIGSYPDIEGKKDDLIVIPEIISKSDSGSDCSFYLKCEENIKQCLEKKIEYHEVEKDHYVLCHLK
ncbi:ABC transporter ATP-binding protein [Candidatus Bathyarchaeota archaeon]|nr:ABC transporter ATP-binding protein [Candidatus Bathyarchaeota archaeon]